MSHKVKFTREERHALTIAKRKGLVKRTAKPSVYYKRLLKKQDIKDAIEGRSVVVKIWHGFTRVVSEMFGGRKVSRAKELGAKHNLNVRRNKLIIPHDRGEIIYNRNTGKLQRYQVIDGKRRRLDLAPGDSDFHSLQQQGYSFRLAFSQGTVFRWNDADRMIADMEKYREFRRWREWITLFK